MSGPAERTAYAEQLCKAVSEALHPHIVSEFAASLDARDPGRPAASLPYIDDVPTDPGLVLTLTTARAALEGADGAVVDGCSTDGSTTTGGTGFRNRHLSFDVRH
ncbi:hypothetical protein OG594_45695 [Streptomyces sp. NBC_01214]|uniref:hypothetical protein n=1 Tax=Streptomyces sp. NBC_01214 TaxID=2903777 RepID=UPI0022525CE9|nr:hypothetical protein [Streptomyces sp. NBC_01214]MCX4808765.1 hypothetical protein [Streptomyces sp. NBC_01214]